LKDDSLKSGEKRYIIQQMDTVLGLDLFREKEHDLDVETIERLIAERNTAKSEKNWARADEIRQQLIDMGISIMDGKDGTTWKVN